MLLSNYLYTLCKRTRSTQRTHSIYSKHLSVSQIYLDLVRASLKRTHSTQRTHSIYSKHLKRDLLTQKKRPTYMAKETYLHSKKRPTYMTKETYLHDKRDLLTQQKETYLHDLSHKRHTHAGDRCKKKDVKKKTYHIRDTRTQVTDRRQRDLSHER